MTNLSYQINSNSEDGTKVVTVFIKGDGVQIAHSSHPNFDKILEGVLTDDPNVLELFDVAKAAADRFESLTERISTANGRLYIDNEEVNDAVAQQVLRFLREDESDWEPLVEFMENVLMNPNEHSKEQLYTWLKDRDFTITDEGYIVGYKSVYASDESFLSVNSGKAIVDGQVKNGRIRQEIGSVVEMPRGEVAHDPGVACHTGLHVGTYDYANTFSGDTILEVHVHPRDVVSVPSDCGAAKMRVCRYTVVGILDKPYTSPVIFSDYEDKDEDDYSGWGDNEDDFTEDALGVDLRTGEVQKNEPMHFHSVADAESGLGCTNPTCSDKPTANLIRARQQKREELASNVKSTDGVNGIYVGDVYEDLDNRRTRTLTVEGFEKDKVVCKTSNGKTVRISVFRLKTPYRFRKV